MATPRAPEKALFFVGILASGRRELAAAAAALVDEFGMPDRCSLVWPFDNTGYYLDELGPQPLRAFAAWLPPYGTDDIAAKKIATNAMETTLAGRLGGRFSRPVNLDPGYLTQAKVVLASAKNYAHRIHLRENIYAEVTLQYRGGRLHTLPWTFPDYASGRYDRFFLELRSVL